MEHLKSLIQSANEEPRRLFGLSAVTATVFPEQEVFKVLYWDLRYTFIFIELYQCWSRGLNLIIDKK